MDKVILVDAVYCLVDEKGDINVELKQYLDSLENRKIVVTNAPLEKYKIYFKNLKDYEIFTLQRNPMKSNPEYFKILLSNFNLKAEEVIYFEHNEEAVKSAKSAGIITFHYNKDKKDIKSLREFIKSQL